MVKHKLAEIYILHRVCRLLGCVEVNSQVAWLDMHVRRCKFAKISEMRAASCGVNPKIRGPQMHKNTQLGKCKFILGTVQWIWFIKQKAFVLKNGH